MLKIQQGEARDVGISFWEIVDAGGQRITEFRHSRFPHILSGAPLYFIDLDLDPRFCENVQAKSDVDSMVTRARPQNGFDPGAEEALRLYIMEALLWALTKQGQAHALYLTLLGDKMDAVRTDAAANGNVVSMNLLCQLRIAC